MQQERLESVVLEGSDGGLMVEPKDILMDRNTKFRVLILGHINEPENNNLRLKYPTPVLRIIVDCIKGETSFETISRDNVPTVTLVETVHAAEDFKLKDLSNHAFQEIKRSRPWERGELLVFMEALVQNSIISNELWNPCMKILVKNPNADDALTRSSIDLLEKLFESFLGKPEYAHWAVRFLEEHGNNRDEITFETTERLRVLASSIELSSMELQTLEQLQSGTLFKRRALDDARSMARERDGNFFRWIFHYLWKQFCGVPKVPEA